MGSPLMAAYLGLLIATALDCTGCFLDLERWKRRARPASNYLTTSPVYSSEVTPTLMYTSGCSLHHRCTGRVLLRASSLVYGTLPRGYSNRAVATRVSERARTCF